MFYQQQASLAAIAGLGESGGVRSSQQFKPKRTTSAQAARPANKLRASASYADFSHKFDKKQGALERSK